MPRRLYVLVVFGFVASLSVVLPVLRAQAPATAARADAEFLRKAYDTIRSMADASPYKNVPWQDRGPTNVSGRATDIAVANRGSSRRIYAAYATSGLSNLDDYGKSWQAVVENQPSTSIGEIAIAPSNPDVVSVGTGESNISARPAGGRRLQVHGRRPNVRAWLTEPHDRPYRRPPEQSQHRLRRVGGPGVDGERDARRLQDYGGGKRGPRFLKSPRTGAINLAMDQQDPNTFTPRRGNGTGASGATRGSSPATMRAACGRPPTAERPGPTRPAGCRPLSSAGGSGLDVSRSNPTVLYAFVDSYEEGRPPREGERDADGCLIMESRLSRAAEVYRTDDKGKTWRKVSESNNFMIQHSGTYGWVFGQIRVDPSDENTIYTLGLEPQRFARRPAGRSSSLRGMHGDHHGLWIDPAEPRRFIYNANDGGYLSRRLTPARHGSSRCRRGRLRSSTTSAVDTSTPAWAYGSIQDIGSRRGTRRSWRTGAGPNPGGRVERTRPGAKDRIRPSIRRTRTSCYSHSVLRQLHARGSDQPAPGEAAAARPPAAASPR